MEITREESIKEKRQEVIDRVANPWKEDRDPLPILIEAFLEQLAEEAMEASKDHFQLSVPVLYYMQVWIYQFGPKQAQSYGVRSICARVLKMSTGVNG